MKPSTICLPESDIPLLLAGDLPPDEVAAAESHLEECDACRATIESMIADSHWWDEAKSSLAKKPSRDVGPGDLVEADEPSPNEQLLELLGPTDDPAMLGRIGTYEIVGILGRGGMGAVFKGYDTALNRFVAIKMLLPHLAASGAARKRFAREAQAAAAVVDDHVMAIHGVSEWKSTPYFVMPYSRGLSLQKRLSNDGPLELREILRIGLQVAKGLAAAHSQGLVHRDIKPANIFLDEGVERVQLMDFGLARAVDDASLTRSGVLAGTPQYMSPEQARAEKVDHQSDLFSLGSVLYAMCVGHAPFRAESSYSVLRLITDREPRPIREINPDIPEWFCAIIGKLMSKQREDRFDSAEQVAELLEDCLAHVQEPTATPLPASVTELAKSFGSRTASATESFGGFRFPPIGKLIGAAAFAFFLIAGTIFFLESRKGTIRIETNSEVEIPIVIRQGDKVVDHLTVSKDGATSRLKAGKYIIEVDAEDAKFTIKGSSVELSRGETWLASISVVNEAAPRMGGLEPSQSDFARNELYAVRKVRAKCTAELAKHRMNYGPRHPKTMQLSQRLDQLDRLLGALDRFKYPKNGKNGITVWRQATPRSGRFSTVHNDDAITLFDAIDSFEDRCAPMDKTAIAVFSEDSSSVEIVDYTTSGPFATEYTLNRGQLVILLAPPEVDVAGMAGIPLGRGVPVKTEEQSGSRVLHGDVSPSDVNVPLKVFEQPENSTSGYWVGVVSEILPERAGRFVSISLKDVDAVKVGELLVVNRLQPEYDVAQYEQFATVEIKSVDRVDAVGLVVASTRKLVDNKYEFMRLQAGDRISRPRIDKDKSSSSIKAATKANAESRPLAAAVDEFNFARGTNDQPPLTEDEVIARLTWVAQYKTKPMHQRDTELAVLPAGLKEILNRIALQRELPVDYSFAWKRGGQKNVRHSAERDQIKLQFGGPKNFLIIRERFIAPTRDVLKPTAAADPDSTPLEAAVTEFNAMHNEIDGQSQPPLTVNEILGAIVDAGSRRDDFPVDSATFASFQRIAKTHALPAGSKLEVLPRFVSESGDTFNIWSVRIVMPQAAKPEWTYGFEIRKQFVSVDSIGDPVVHWGKPNDDGLQAGFRLFPSQRTYQVGQTIKTEFFYRSVSGKRIPAQLPNLFAHQELTAEDATGNLLEVVEVKNKLPGGAIATQVGQQPIRVKGSLLQLNYVNPAADHNIHESQQPVTHLKVKLGQTISLQYKVSDLHGGTLHTGESAIEIRAEESDREVAAADLFADSLATAADKLGLEAGNRIRLSSDDDDCESDHKPTPKAILESLARREKLEPKTLVGLYEKHRDDFHFEVTKIKDEMLPERQYPRVGPASLHRLQFKCKVTFSETIKSSWPIESTHKGEREEIVYIGMEHLHGNNTSEKSGVPVPQDADVIRELKKLFGLKHEELTQLWKNKREHFQIEISQIVGESQEARFFPDVGYASPQRAHFKCTVRISDGSKLVWPGTNSSEPQTVYITKDYKVPDEVMTWKEPSVGRTDLKFHEVDRITSPDLESVCSVVFSPDGKHLYAAARDVCNLLVYQQVDSGSGPHTKLVQTIHSDENLEGALGLRVTPDGKFVVVTAFHSKTVCLYARDAETGKLTEKHVARDGLNGVIGLHWAFDCEVSPDSRFVYVTSSHTNRDASRLPEEGEGNVTVFEIAGEKLRWVQTLTSSENTFDGAVHITTHPSGDWLFVANYRSNAVVMLGRDQKTGEVTLSQAVYDNDELSLDGVYGVRCSPDGKYLYASSGRFRGEHGVTVFSLSAHEDFAGGFSGPDILMKPIQTIRGGTPELPNFAGGNRVIVSDDGERVYVMGSLSGTLAAFERYSKSGKLTEATVSQVTTGELGPASICDSTDGNYIYAAAQSHSSITVLQRNGQDRKTASQAGGIQRPARNDTVTRAKPQRATSADAKSPTISEPTAAQYRDDLKRLNARAEFTSMQIKETQGLIERIKKDPKAAGNGSVGITSIEAQQTLLKDLEQGLAGIHADEQFIERQLLSYLSVLEERCKVATKAKRLAQVKVETLQKLIKQKAVAEPELGRAQLELDEANLKLAEARRRKETYKSVADELKLSPAQSANLVKEGRIKLAHISGHALLDLDTGKTQGPRATLSPEGFVETMDLFTTFDIPQPAEGSQSVKVPPPNSTKTQSATSPVLVAEVKRCLRLDDVREATDVELMHRLRKQPVTTDRVFLADKTNKAPIEWIVETNQGTIAVVQVKHESKVSAEFSGAQPGFDVTYRHLSLKELRSKRPEEN
jgi:serine/threonine protein kinase/6-phosphogluconolactonase (cycloisomerase 2 family)